MLKATVLFNSCRHTKKILTLYLIWRLVLLSEKEQRRKPPTLKFQAECIELKTALISDHCGSTGILISFYMDKLVFQSVDVIILISLFPVPELKKSIRYFRDTYIFD